ncbi:hypothetical protein GCM10025859_07200 [Alicyclobacillus fastidiosus]|nr:hypothetical protein GCM10025859_07200 [Alicyclobacillus fastidiosus]
MVSAWWAEEARQYGGIFSEHDDRYDRTREFVQIMKGLWTQTIFSYHGKYYDISDAKLTPKPIQRPNPVLYAGGESEKGKDLITSACDAYVMHGGTVDEIRVKIEDMAYRASRSTCHRSVLLAWQPRRNWPASQTSSKALRRPVSQVAP